MKADKTDFFKDLSSLMLKPIYLTDQTDEINEEIKYNHWVLAVPSGIVSRTTTAEFLAFIQKVKDNYKSQLDKSSLDIDLIFYLWFEEPGELCFNFINSNHKSLPFECKLRYTNRAEEIVDEYLKSKYHDQVLPWDEFQTVESSEEIAAAGKLEEELKDYIVLTVYQERIRKQI